MRSKLFFAAITAAIFLSPLSLSSLSLDEALSGQRPEVLEAMVDEGEAYRLDREGEGLLLVPHLPLMDELADRIAELDPDVLTEGLYLIPYPQGTDEIDLDVYNLTRRVSAISDVVYKSHRRDAYVPLFDNVYAIDNLDDREPVPDPVVSSIPARESVLMHMEEVNLGSAYYETEYVWNDGSLGFFLWNRTNLRKVLKVVGKENMQISLIISPVDEGFLVYGVCGIKLSNSNAVYSMMDPYTGFYRRMYAMVTWIYNTMHGTDRLPDLKKSLDF